MRQLNREEHFHVHVVPRRADDGLPLPWVPHHAACGTAENGDTGDVDIVMAREPLPLGSSVVTGVPVSW